MKYRLYILVLLLLLNVSCERQLSPFDLPEHTPKLVANCLFTEGKVFEVFVCKSASTFDTLDEFISDAKVRIYTEGVLFEELQHTKKGIYKGTESPKTGHEYQLIIEHPNFPVLKAKDIIPEQVIIENYTVKNEAGLHYWGEFYSQAEVLFTDNQDLEDYYEISGRMKYEYSVEYSTEYSYQNLLDMNTVEDIVLNSEDILDFYSPVFLFSDELINGKTYNLKIPLVDLPRLDFHNRLCTLEFRTISETYYKYKKCLIKHLYNQGGNEIEVLIIDTGNPLPMYSNIENGYGIFAAYNISIISF